MKLMIFDTWWSLFCSDAYPLVSFNKRNVSVKASNFKPINVATIYNIFALSNFNVDLSIAEANIFIFFQY